MDFENAVLENKVEDKNMENTNKNERIVVDNKKEVSAADLAEADLRAAEKAEEARKSIFGMIGNIFKGKEKPEKTEKEKYEEDIKNLDALIHSLTHIKSVPIEGAGFSGSGIDFSKADTEEIRSKLKDLVQINASLKGLDVGSEKRRLTDQKIKLIKEIYKIGRAQIENKYNIAA